MMKTKQIQQNKLGSRNRFKSNNLVFIEFYNTVLPGISIIIY